MYVVTGITGQVGGVVAQTLLAAGKNVRAVVRDMVKGESWKKKGCEIAVADMYDESSLTAAFHGAEAVFALIPPNFDPKEGFQEVRDIGNALSGAIRTAKPGRIVCISTIGAQAAQVNLLSQLSFIEKILGDAPIPITFLRPAWFMENTLWDIGPARQLGAFPSYLQPVDREIPMVATADVGHVAAELMLQRWEGKRVVELEGPERVSPNKIATTLGNLLSRDVRATAVPRTQWENQFREQGVRNPMPRIRMLDGFNEGWICFETTPRKGNTSLERVLRNLIDKAR